MTNRLKFVIYYSDLIARFFIMLRQLYYHIWVRIRVTLKIGEQGIKCYDLLFACNLKLFQDVVMFRTENHYSSPLLIGDNLPLLWLHNDAGHAPPFGASLWTRMLFRSIFTVSFCSKHIRRFLFSLPNIQYEENIFFES